MRRLLLVLLALPLAGCTWFDEGSEPFRPPTGPSIIRPPELPPLWFGGDVVDAVTGAPVAQALVRIDLAFTRPCRQQGIGYASWEPPVDENGRFGLFRVPRPNSDDVAFFVHVTAPGYAENVTFIGPAEASGDIGNVTYVLHPEAALTGNAPPGTLLALDAPGFPRIVVANATGRYAFASARVAEVQLVAATALPQRANVTPPLTLDFEEPAGRGWTLEGILRRESGAPVAANVVAWNGTLLWSVARAADNGLFSLPLPPQGVELRIEARTPDGALGGTKALGVQGPPAVRESLLLRPLC